MFRPASNRTQTSGQDGTGPAAVPAVHPRGAGDHRRPDLRHEASGEEESGETGEKCGGEGFFSPSMDFPQQRNFGL